MKKFYTVLFGIYNNGGNQVPVAVLVQYFDTLEQSKNFIGGHLATGNYGGYRLTNGAIYTLTENGKLPVPVNPPIEWEKVKA